MVPRGSINKMGQIFIVGHHFPSWASCPPLAAGWLLLDKKHIPYPKVKRIFLIFQLFNVIAVYVTKCFDVQVHARRIPTIIFIFREVTAQGAVNYLVKRKVTRIFLRYGTRMYWCSTILKVVLLCSFRSTTPIGLILQRIWPSISEIWNDN